MSLKERVYSVLVVSSSKSFGAAISSMLPKSDFSPVVFENTVNAAQRTFNDRSFDFVIVDAPLSDDLGLRFAIDCSSMSRAVVLALVRHEIFDEVYERLSRQGVFALSKPLSKQTMQNALRWILTAKGLTERYAKKSTSIEDKMQEIRLINKAKWALINNKNMTEPEAHRYLEKEAMNRCITKAQLASQILENE